MNYYNEFDPHAAKWLRNLIEAGTIAPGEVDERSIEDVTPNDLRGFTQCHFFAGIGGWAYALDLAGWPRDRPVWTGSCPCQPFSAAGKGAGFEDERHLWPAWQHLIAQCRPAILFGEQVASKAVDPWIDLVHADLEGMGYAFGGIAFPAAGIGAPHIRDRTYWLADANGGQRDGIAVMRGNERDGEDAGRPQGIGGAAACGDVRWLGHADDTRSQGHAGHGGAAGWQGPERPATEASVSGSVANAASSGRREERADGGRVGEGDSAQGIASRPEHGSSDHRPGPTNGQWADADWLHCTDGKWRPVEPGTFPLAHGLPGRVGLLRGYGNAIVPQAAAEFIAAAM